MYLSELELQGFKSFAQKTKVRFDSGITAIVGPNGCGKSNIVDALRWSLGEQRPSQLRSASMSNVIFNGTAKRKSLGMAEVSLTIINNKGVLPTEFSDVTITRRLYRSGESEYLLNKAPCRLKDIVDLFMDTGMGSNAYSVIELKMVEEILNDKNNDRRKLFEEASGITKYKERKKQTLRKLTETHGDMQRVEDILLEVRKKTQSLQVQAKKAERAKAYEADLRKLDLAVSKSEYERCRQELEPLKDKIVQSGAEKEALIRKLSESEQAEEKAQLQLIEKERVQLEAQKEVARIGRIIQQLETDIRIHRERIANEEGTIRQYEEDIVEAEKEIKELRRDGKDASLMLAEATQQLEASKKTLNEAEVLFLEVQEEANKLGEQVQQTNRQHQDITRQLNDLQNKRIRLEARIQNAEEQRVSLTADEDRIAVERDRSSENIPEFEVSLQKAILLQEEVEDNLEKNRKFRDELFGKLNQYKDEIRSLKSKSEALRNEIALLEGLARSNEVFPDSVRFVKEQNANIPAISDIFHTSDRYAVALEAALADAVNFLVVPNRAEAEKISDQLKIQKRGKATFVPLDILPDDYPVHENAIYHQVTFEPAYDALARLLLGNVLLAEHRDHAWNEYQPGTVVATLQGDVITSRGFLRSGSKGANEGLRLGLRERIDNLSFEAEKCEVAHDEVEEELDRLQKQFDAIDLHQLSLIVRDANSSRNSLEQQMNDFEARKQMYNERLTEINKRKEELAANIQEARNELEEIQPQALTLEKKLEEILRQQVELRTQSAVSNDSRERALRHFNEQKLTHQQIANEVSNFTREVQRSEEGIQNVKNRLQQRAETARQGKDRIIQYRELITEFTEKRETSISEKALADKKLEEAEEAAAVQRGRIHHLESELRVLRQKKDVTTDLLHSLDKQLTEIEVESRRYTDHVWEEYGLLMNQITEEIPEDTDLATAKETIYTLKQRLKNIGQVNELAIEEYEEEKKRLDHTEEQLADLRDAEEKLQETIREINETAQGRFLTTFEEIRTNFRTVFNTLFEENDHCDLILQKNEEDPLESKIEIIANPRGKRPSVIEQLSGGEKTLTAIALLFAIYLVKPSPFCILDEVDAPLDDANIERFAKLLRQFSHETQFIVITHNKNTMEKAEMMYGVTMPEPGVSKLVGVRLDEITSK